MIASLAGGGPTTVPAVLPGLDVERVGAWLESNVDDVAGPFSAELIGGGRSNLTYALTAADGRRLVVRRPPLGHVLATAHDMSREHRIITALGPTAVPVPATRGLCTDEDVNGAPFYVMDFIDGVVLDGPEKGAQLAPSIRTAASHHLIDVLADLHAVDVDEVGLGDLARREGYIERQLKRWTTQWANSKTRELPAIDEVAAHLASRVPAQQGVAIAHGDYRFGNCLTDVVAGRIAAVLDWELCTLGDPLADVGYLGVAWTDPGVTPRRHNDPSGSEGFPTYAELVERYARRTGRDVSGVDYYVAFSSWRLAVISEGVYARFLHGAMGDQGLGEAELAAMREGTTQLAEAALEAVHRLG
jgi:aminoglycoside phosphotransferase (APT) family kinase protein